MSKLFINEQYLCMQGEGPRAGWPSVLIRTSGCSLRCKWCDTPFTSWTPTGEMKTVDEIMEEVGKLSNGFKIRDCIISGGEPAIQDIVELIQRLVGRGMDVTIETSGSVLHTSFIHFEEANKGWFSRMSVQGRIVISCSPKLLSSTPDSGKEKEMHEKNRLNRDVLEWLQGTFSSSMYIKSVITDLEKDVAEIEGLLEAGVFKPWVPIYLMSQGKTQEELALNSKKVYEMALQKNWRYTPRLHVDIYNSQRGV